MQKKMLFSLLSFSIEPNNSWAAPRIFFLNDGKNIFFPAFGNNRRKVYEMENIEFRVESGNQS